MSDDAELAARLYPLLRDRLMREPMIWGDPSRVEIDPTAAVVNALFNTSSGRIVIEPYVFFGHNVCLLTGTHDVTKIDRARQDAWPHDGRDIIVRRGVWLASNVTVLGPAVIGEHAAVAAGSVVVGDVPPRALYAGVPARLVNYIETDD
jgi:acetyltransferase-like isoleucine patch superfamily enzyme